MEFDKKRIITTLGSVGFSFALTTGILLPSDVSAQNREPAPPIKPTPELLLPPRGYVQTLTVGRSRIIFDQATKARFVDSCDRDLEKVLRSPRIGEVFRGVHDMGTAEVLHSLQIYGRMYCFAEIISGVRREDLTVAHGYETRFSQDPNPGRGGYVGAMQRDRDLYPDQEVEAISDLLNFLDVPDQRYRSAIHTNESIDYREIIWAGIHIADRARSFYPNMPFDDAVRKVIAENYSANGAPRLVRADLLRSLR